MADEKFLFTRAEAVAWLRRAPPRSRFAVHISGDAPIAGKPDSIFPGCLRGYVNLSRKEAIRIAGEMISDTMEERGARVPCHVYRYDEKSNGTYWIGG